MCFWNQSLCTPTPTLHCVTSFLLGMKRLNSYFFFFRGKQTFLNTQQQGKNYDIYFFYKRSQHIEPILVICLFLFSDSGNVPFVHVEEQHFKLVQEPVYRGAVLVPASTVRFMSDVYSSVVLPPLVFSVVAVSTIDMTKDRRSISTSSCC